MSPTVIGVDVRTNTIPTQGAVAAVRDAQLFVVGMTERGDTAAPVLIQSMAEAVDRLGDRVAFGWVYDTLQGYFSEAAGGGRVWVQRVAGPAAAAGSLTLLDRAGTPLQTLKINAASAGAWSANVTVEVVDGAFGGTYTLLIRYRGLLEEQYQNLATPSDAVIALASSRFVRGVDQASGTTGTNKNPAVAAATALSSGTDDRGAVDTAAHLAALTKFTKDLGPGIVAIPGQPASATAVALASHCQATDRIAAIAPAAASSKSSAQSGARTLRTTPGAEYLGFFYPWVQITDSAGTVRTVPPEGYVAGVRAKAITQVGPWRAPFGEIAASSNLTGTEMPLAQSDVDSLTLDCVNTIRGDLPGGVRLYGWRSLSTDLPTWRSLAWRDTLNVLSARSREALEFVVGQTIDSEGHLFTAVDTALAAVVAPAVAAGGLFAHTDEDGNETDPGYAIDTGSAVNTPTTIQAGVVNAVLAVRLAASAELVRVLISKVAVAADF